MNEVSKPTIYFRYYLKLLSLPLLFVVLYVTLKIVWEVFDLPSAEVLAQQVRFLFDKYGTVTIFFGALIEGVLLVGGYFPGVFIIFIGVIIASSASQAAFFVTIGTLGLLAGHSINYLLGKYGWYRLLVKFGLKSSVEESKNNLLNKGPVAIFSTYWLPSLAALTDTAAGIIQMPFKKFITYSILSSVFWNSVVGIIVYTFNDFALSVASPGGNNFRFVLLALAIWMLALLFTDYRKNKNILTLNKDRQ